METDNGRLPRPHGDVTCARRSFPSRRSPASPLLAVNPGSVVAAFARFDGWTLVPVFGLMLAFYALQGLRWHLLLLAVGARGRLRDSQVLNLAGQAMTAVLPLGDLTRALLAGRAFGVEAGAAAATVTVQELCFTLLVALAAVPALSRLPNGTLWICVVAGGIGAVVLVLSVARVFRGVHRVVAAAPVLRRFAADIATLQREASRLLRRPDVAAGSLIDLGRVLVATAALLLVLRGLHVTTLGWWDIALVLAASFIGGALSFLPGGVGANEATVVGVLLILGVSPATAAAAAILQRLTLTVVPAAGGGLAYLALRWRSRSEPAAGRQPRGTCTSRSISTASLIFSAPINP